MDEKGNKSLKKFKKIGKACIKYVNSTRISDFRKLARVVFILHTQIMEIYFHGTGSFFILTDIAVRNCKIRLHFGREIC